MLTRRWQQHLRGVDYRAKEAPDPRLLSMTCGPVDELKHRIALNNILAAMFLALPLPSVFCMVLGSVAPLLIVSRWNTGQMAYFNVTRQRAELTSLGSYRLHRHGSQAVAKPSRLVLKNIFEIQDSSCGMSHHSAVVLTVSHSDTTGA